jgi:phosphate/sulfate permease
MLITAPESTLTYIVYGYVGIGILLMIALLTDEEMTKDWLDAGFALIVGPIWAFILVLLLTIKIIENGKEKVSLFKQRKRDKKRTANSKQLSLIRRMYLLNLISKDTFVECKNITVRKNDSGH